MDSNNDQTDILISALEHYSYCPRQCALIHIEQTYDENLYTMRGKLLHERVDSGEEKSNRGVITTRSIVLWSEVYGIRGKSDVVEWNDGIPYPVEYKVGSRKGMHTDVQLCAQALCLEEMLGVVVPRGAVYYGATRRRHEVLFDEYLRMQTTTMIVALRMMIDTQVLPEAPNDQRCKHCSLIHSCMPTVVSQHRRLEALNTVLYTPLKEV